MSKRGEIDSFTVVTNQRNYFFNVKENRRGDFFLNIVESVKHISEFERHSIIIYEEDLDNFIEAFENSITSIKEARKNSENIVRKKPKRIIVKEDKDKLKITVKAEKSDEENEVED